MANLDELINDISMLGLTKEASAAVKPEDNLVNILQGISSQLTKTASDDMGEMGEAEVEGPSDEATEVAGAIVQNPEPIAAAVATAVADVLGNKAPEAAPEAALEGENMNENLIQKISSAVAQAVKVAVEGDVAFGLAADASQGSAAGAGTVQNMAEKLLEAKTTQPAVTDSQMVSPGGAVDPMIGIAPTTEGGEQKPLQGAGIKAAMAAMSDEDAEMMFKLASIGYDVSVETLSDEIVQEKVAQAQYAEKVAQAQYAQQHNSQNAARRQQAEKVAQAAYVQTLRNAGYNY